ncbi:hypothetical protein BKI52_10905 [marine bacterium AO1-C]|nr:hypothetical protein BKI52_10905 [marine bacterium AO1-C]
MKTKYVLLIVLLLAGTTSQAQFGKLKAKLKSKTSKSKKVKSKRSKDGEPEYDPNNKVSQAQRSAKQALSFVEKGLQKKNWEASSRGIKKDLQKARKNLDVLKGEDSENNRKYYKNYEARYAQFKNTFATKMQAYGEKKAVENYFVEAHRNLRVMNDEFYTKKAFGEAAKRLDYKGEFAKKKASYQASNKPNARIDKYVKAIDEFYNNAVPKEYIPAMVKYIDKETKSAFDKKKWEWRPQDALKTLAKGKKVVEIGKMLSLKPSSELKASENKLEAHRKMIQEYIDSGKYEAYKAKVKQKRIDEKRVNKVGMRNPQAEAIAKNALAKKFGVPVLRIAIGSVRWDVKKNNVGVPLYKYLYVEGAIKKKDGNCHVVVAWVRRSYEGGGRYGAMFAADLREDGQINCANIYK